MNKFEQVSSDHHQMSLVGVPRYDCLEGLEGVHSSDGQGLGVLYLT